MGPARSNAVTEPSVLDVQGPERMSGTEGKMPASAPWLLNVNPCASPENVRLKGL